LHSVGEIATAPTCPLMPEPSVVYYDCICRFELIESILVVFLGLFFGAAVNLDEQGLELRNDSHFPFDK
jgi:hypothetical protein